MSETEEHQDEPQPEPADQAASDADAGRRATRTGGLVVALLIVVSLLWYLLADRFTPYTDQARIQAYVIGIAPQVAGTVQSVDVQNNQLVEDDGILFRIDPSQYEIALNKARSDLDSASRQVDAGGAAVETARANLRAALANQDRAEKDYARLQRLYEEDPGTVSVRRLELSQASLDQARAQVSAAQSEIRRAIEMKGGEDDADNAILKAAISAVEKAELDVARTTVRAPSRGLITDLRAEVGQFAGTGNPVLTFISLRDMWISAEFTENNLGHLEPGTEVEILFDALPGRVFDGEIRSIGLGVSSGQTPPPGNLPNVQNDRDWLRQSQRFPVIITFDVEQDPELLRQLRVGGQASVVGYSEGHGVLKLLGMLHIRLMSLFSYAY